jgi:uncharacterized SAM-binding protein YcdF (DUF218 family)
MFTIKKTIAPFLLPPGMFIVILVAVGAILTYKKQKKIGLLNVFLGCLIWILSIAPTSDLLLSGLESDFYKSNIPEGDAIILLGGGVRENVRDLSGVGFPGGDMLGRMVTAVRLHNQLNIPIIISFGEVFEDRNAGAPIVRRFLIELGVDGSQIILEEKSRDTYENAKYSKEICEKMGYTSPILLTSGYHLKRSNWIFNHIGLAVAPFPAYFTTHETPEYNWRSFLPNRNSLTGVSNALHEYLGLIYYKLKFRRVL